ncbi:MAG: sugar phosphate isomerase/epimerase family protein [Thermoguttaceae bacterium]
MNRQSALIASRRDFLRQGLAATLAAERLLVSAASAGEAPPRNIVVGAHPWVYAATQPQYDITPILDSIFGDMKYAGIDGIELMHTALQPDDAVERIGTLVEKHALPVLGTSYGAAMWDRGQHASIFQDAEKVIGRLARLGGKTFGTSVGQAGHKKTDDELDAQAELLKRIIAVAESHGVVVNLHNHKYEVENELHDLRGTLARIPQVKLGPDLDWLVQAGVDPVKFLLDFGDRIVFLHLRDQKKDKTWVEAMGEGDMDYGAVRDALQKIHFQGHAVIELAHPRDLKLTRPLRESLKLSRQYVRKTLGF